MKKKQDIRNFTRNKLISWFEKHNLPGFRGKQVFNWLYKNYVSQFSQMKNLPDDLLELLQENFYISNLECYDKQFSEDGTVKFLWGLADGNTIESVFLPYGKNNRYSACISSQVGCKLGCEFCATGKQGFIRNLTAGEIVDQVLKINENIFAEETSEFKLSNIVFMGMGEPLHNFAAVLTGIKIINDQKGINMGQRKITISTAGVVPKIKKLADLKLQVGLAVSLNAPSDELRSKIMPINDLYPLDDLFSAVKYYLRKTNRRVSFEYVLIKEWNDTPQHAFQLAKLLENINCHLNLIPANPSLDLNVKPPRDKKIKKFIDILLNSGINVTRRKRKGTDINAACGQLKSSRKQEGSNGV
ncbi:MAG: 23S rRNA (adenine(2503)-C(2))-methyltransferase RlmN [Bacillota bacterium]